MDAPDPAEVPEPGERAPMQPRLRKAWHVLCFSEEPVTARCRGRSDSRSCCFADLRARSPADRCPHRNVPLSRGRVVEGRLACSYHGWQSPRTARATLCPRGPGREPCPALPVLPLCGAAGGRVGVGGPGSHQTTSPTPFAALTHPATRWCVGCSVPRVRCTPSPRMRSTSRTAFAHGGLFRDDSDRSPITCRVTRTARSGVRVHRRGPSRRDHRSNPLAEWGHGGAPRPVSPPEHCPGRYRIGDENHILDAALTPVSDHETRLHAVVPQDPRADLAHQALRAGCSAAHLWARPGDPREPDRDAAPLRRRTLRVDRADALGPHILRLMRQAERGR